MPSKKSDYFSKVTTASSGCQHAALRSAAADGDVATAEQQLLAGCSVDAAKEHGRTALHLAAEAGHTAVAAFTGCTRSSECYWFQRLHSPAPCSQSG